MLQPRLLLQRCKRHRWGSGATVLRDRLRAYNAKVYRRCMWGQATAAAARRAAKHAARLGSDLGLVRAQRLQHARCHALALAQQAHQDVLCADVVVACRPGARFGWSAFAALPQYALGAPVTQPVAASLPGTWRLIGPTDPAAEQPRSAVHTTASATHAAAAQHRHMLS